LHSEDLDSVLHTTDTWRLNATNIITYTRHLSTECETLNISPVSDYTNIIHKICNNAYIINKEDDYRVGTVIYHKGIIS